MKNKLANEKQILTTAFNEITINNYFIDITVNNDVFFNVTLEKLLDAHQQTETLIILAYNAQRDFKGYLIFKFEGKTGIDCLFQCSPELEPFLVKTNLFINNLHSENEQSRGNHENRI